MVAGLRDLRSRPWHVILPVAVFVLLSIAGISYSSIGIDDLREDPDHPAGLMLGDARSIRSDEFLTSTPLNVGVTATGSTDDENPLSAPQEMFSGLPSGPVSSVVLFDGTALRLGPWLPDSVLVAARAWLPFLLLALGAPVWFRFLTGSPRIGWFAVALIALSPASAWWSFAPVAILGPALAGAAALILCADALRGGNRWPAVAWGVVSAVVLARTPLAYPPWAIILVPAVLVATAAAVIARPSARRSALVALGGVGGLTIALFAGVVLENRAAIGAVSNTVYPGARITTGGPNPFQEIFGATSLQVLSETPGIVGSNASEISSSFAVLFVWAALLLAHKLGITQRHHRAALLGTLAVSACWVAWSTIDFGKLGEQIPLANLVPSARAADVLGFLAVILICLLLPHAGTRNSLGFATVCAVACGAVAAYAGSLLRQQNIAGLSLTAVWLSSLLLAVVVFVISFRPRSWPGYALGVLLATALVWSVNPVLFGLGDLRGTSAARELLTAGRFARQHGQVWASDAYSVDTLMIATGVPALSGRQISGPDREAWSALDADGSHEEIWNRGGSFIWFEWNDQADLTWSNPSPDSIKIAGSPCTLAERVPDLRTIVATRQLELDCLTETDDFEWGGVRRWVYDVNPGPGARASG